MKRTSTTQLNGRNRLNDGAGRISGKFHLFSFASLMVFLFICPGWIHKADSRSADVLWAWSGAVTPKSVVVKARVSPGIRMASIHVNPTNSVDKAGTKSMNIDAEADADGIVTFRIDGLQPDREYAYAVKANGEAGRTGRFHTVADGPMSFRICFASCASTGSNHKIFDTLKSLQPFLFIHMGDFHYENIEQNNPSLFRKAYDRVLTSPRQGGFYRSTPIAYVYDDHDFGPDDADGTSPSKPAALHAYQQCVPHYPLSRVNGEVRTIQQAFTVGRVRFLMLDVRSERSPQTDPDGPDKTMLGKYQLDWLRSELREAENRYPLVILVNPVSWITKETPHIGDGWEPYNYERTVIADMIKEANLVNRLIMLSGDGHMAAIDDGTNSNYAGGGSINDTAFPVIHAAPIDRYPRIKGGPYSHGTSAPNRWLRLLKIRQFGVMDLKDNGERLQIQVSCRNSKWKILENLELKIECGPDGCRIF